MSSITRHSYLYLWLWISLRKPLLDVTCDGEKHLLHIQVCLGTLKDTEICESKTTANCFFIKKKSSLKVSCKSGKQHTVSKNLIPYSSASACPFAVGTAWSNSSSKIYYLANWRKRIKHLTTYFKQEIQSENSQTFKETMSSGMYPLAFVHIGLVANQNFVDIIRGMLFNVPNPVSDVCILDEPIANKW